MTAGKVIAAPLLVLQLSMSVVILLLSGNLLSMLFTHPDSWIAGKTEDRAGYFLILYGAEVGVVSIAAVITGIHHVRVWSMRSAAAAQAAGWIAWSFEVIPLYLACRDIFLNLRASRGSELRMMGSCIIILSVSQFFYNLALYIDDWYSYSNSYPGSVRLG